MSADMTVFDFLQSGDQPDFPQSRELGSALSKLEPILKKMEKLVVPEALDRTVNLSQHLEQFAVRVSLIGQVKAGKTALTNALIGMPEMLPSDVNPWTSVVTSVHINTPRPRGHGAVFTFFNREEWSSMTETGGRLGEMAQRADFEDEYEKMQLQVQEMQEKAERRLGRNFELLLGNTHSFTGFNPKLVNRYVCLGDEEDAPQEGRFADLTKSADLYTDDHSYPLPFVIQDTPGVNDPFLVRETVTLDNLTDADICVIVLSAHQAFSTVDIALMRILLALKQEQIVLFVNRIDELEDPHNQIREIDTYIHELLVEQGLSEDIPIVFGSAEWAEAASFGMLDGEMLEDSRDSLEKLASDRLAQNGGHLDPGHITPGTSKSVTRKIHDLSGLHELKRVIDEKASASIGFPFVRLLKTNALDVLQQSALLLNQTKSSTAPIRADLNIDEFIDRLDEMLKTANDECDRVTKVCTDYLLFSMSAAYNRFIEKEKNDLLRLINRGGAVGDWAPDTEDLRRQLNTCYKKFGETGMAEVEIIFRDVADRVAGFYQDILEQDEQLFTVVPPLVSAPKTPTSLMKTMTIDLSSGWLSGWFSKRLNKSAYVKRFCDISRDEMANTIGDMRDIYVADFLKQTRLSLHDFLFEHITTLQSLSALGSDEQRAEMRRKLGMENEITQRLIAIDQLRDELLDISDGDQAAPAQNVSNAVS